MGREEEGEEVLDALLEQGIDPDDIENPTCPRCFNQTLLAYREGEEYTLITWECLTEEDDAARPDAWYLVCQNLLCPYEEEIERALDPRGATPFELQYSHWALEDEIDLLGRNPSEMTKLIAYLERVKRTHPHWKLDCFLEEARWRREWDLKQIRKWLASIPPGRRIEFWAEGEDHKVKFYAATDDALLVENLSDGQMMVVRAEALQSYGPRQFDPEGDKPPLEARNVDPDSWISLCGYREFVVAQGHHLHLYEVDRFSQFHVGTDDPLAAAALGLEPQGESYWRGKLRRSQIEARYEKRKMVKVKGYWVEVHGKTARTHSPSVSTEDAEVAAALGLKPCKRFWVVDPEEPGPPEIARWSGIIPSDQVEQWDEVCVYQWPIPEIKEG
ncbi:MAG: hypothetical protein ACOY93_10805 [Bacillota bacterium]